MTDLNRNLSSARRAKEDEFYTQLADIERELKHYQEHFDGKVVYCNADDPRISNFFHYFSHNFERLGLKKLITTCYQSRQRDLFSRRDSDQAIYLEYKGDKNDNRVPDLDEIGVYDLKGDGDFRSDECVALLKESDVVVTNPPFSLFREFVAQMVEYDKKFLILGNKNAVTYKEVFPLIRADKLWIGHTPMGTEMVFDVPEDFGRELVASGKDRKYTIIGGVVKARSQACWFTNMDFAKRHEDLVLYKSYTAEEYPKYDNYDAINVSRTTDIPMDYAGVMGVPISFLDKYNPSQFEIVDANLIRSSPDVPYKEHGLIKDKESAINGRATYVRIAIRNKRL